MTARITDTSGQVVLNEVTTLAPERFAAGRGADYRVDLPLERLASGDTLSPSRGVQGSSLSRGAVFASPSSDRLETQPAAATWLSSGRGLLLRQNSRSAESISLSTLPPEDLVGHRQALADRVIHVVVPEASAAAGQQQVRVAGERP